MSFCQKRNQDSLKLSRSHSVWALKCSSPKICHSLLDHSVSRRGSEAHKQCNEGGVECGAHSWVCVCTCVCARVCVPAHTRVQPHPPAPPNNSKPQRSVGEACLKPKLWRTATSLLWPFPRQAWPFIYKKFQPRPLDKGGQTRRSCSELVRRQAGVAPEGISGMLMVCLSGGLQSPELGLRTPSVEAQEVS